ncbi:FAD/NAD(P)-binding domain-containing protein [Sistotremastrum suecicum HHB10207 ss-3]|uniref:FAD/NAD(P)-binding domain-containing protein n=1 Tax=Sistotremastrum suecicum HHB10207 ss-3 TaxID=1314776 RepID=A0A165Y109_9AGAM|nr:FAD/NAD(P)-binding domain-containing protein [Sistotremastrum suecicum HHB10207 ss-3]
MAPASTVDVLVVGGGPTGLLTALSCAKMGLKVQCLEQHDRARQGLYGRACVLFARTLELMDQLGVYQDISEIGYIMKGAYTYRDGQPVVGKGWVFVDKTLKDNTFFEYTIGIRQKYSEDVFRKYISQIDPEACQAPATLIDYKDDPSQEYPITAIVDYAGQQREVRAKILVGADGARSKVREKTGVDFPGEKTTQRWIRMDGVLKTNMPTGQTHVAAIESKTHGNILWLPVDHGRIRVGYALPKELADEFNNGLKITVDIAIREAQKAVAPFTLEYETVDWFTVYAISQRVAAQYRTNNVILAGDACHTHSSGAAQGMNTGVHDAVNLGWKLGGYLRGWYTEDVLNSYDTERRKAAQQVITIDKYMSTLITGKIPEDWKSKYPANADANDVLDDLFQANAEFTVGLGISYDINPINREINPKVLSKVQAGHRAPDIALSPPGGNFPKRLYELTPNNGKFSIVIFAGTVGSIDLPLIRRLSDYLASPQSFANRLTPEAFQFVTIIGGDAFLPFEILGVEPWGRVVYDPEGKGAEKYGIDPKKGALVALRPDSILGYATALNEFELLANYFAGIVKPALNWSAVAEKKFEQTSVMGEISVEGTPETSNSSQAKSRI